MAQLSFELTSLHITLLKQLDRQFAQYYARLEALSSDEKAFLHRQARISMVGASTRIENALLTDTEINWIDTLLMEDGKPTAFRMYQRQIVNKLAKDKERSIEEVAGCREALALVYEEAQDWCPLQENIIRGLHQRLLQYHPPAAHYLGRYKTQSNYVIEKNTLTQETRIVFKTADPGPITAAAMSDLVSWYQVALEQETWVLAVTSEWVFRFLAIHPFQDGNGRLGRALFLLTLLQSTDKVYSTVARYLAIDRYIEKHKAEYYQALNQCSNGQFKQNPRTYKIGYFLTFMLRMLAEAFAGIDFYQERYKTLQKLSPSAIRVLECFKEHPEIRLQTHLICTETGLPRRTVLNALRSLLRDHFIQRYGQGAGCRYQWVF